MKKLIFFVAALFTLNIALADDTPIEYNKIPQVAKSFIATNFAKTKVLSSTVDKEFMEVEYTVYLEKGAKVEFDSKGNWKTIDCQTSAVPTAIVPAKITSYVTTTYPGMLITKIDKDKSDYEVELSNDLDLKFSLAGDFIRLDD